MWEKARNGSYPAIAFASIVTSLLEQGDVSPWNDEKLREARVMLEGYAEELIERADLEGQGLSSVLSSRSI